MAPYDHYEHAKDNDYQDYGKKDACRLRPRGPLF